MRLLKAFLAGVAGLLVIITLFSLLIPSRVRVSRVVLIDHVGYGEVYPQIAQPENWKNWHPVFTVDSARLYQDTIEIAGNYPAYHILQHGKDIVIQLLPSDSTSINFLLRARGENDIDNTLVITPIPSLRSVQVEWRAVTKLHWYPWEKMYGIFIDRLTGPGYETALQGLKHFIEKSPASRPVGGGT